jgi:acyl dehydratase
MHFLMQGVEMHNINPSLREPSFEAVVVGEEIGPVKVVCDEHYLRQACFAVDDYSGFEQRDGQAPLVPSSIVLRDLVAHFCSVYDPSRVVGLHQREEAWFARPVRLGMQMLYTGRYIDKFEQRGKGYVVFEAEARDAADGALLVRQISTEIMRIPEGVQLGTGSAAIKDDRVKGVWPADRKPAETAGADIEPGTPIPPLTKVAHQDQMSVFSGVNKQWTNIHTSVAIARAAGFRDTLAQGAMETCWLGEMLLRFFGEAWLRTGWIKNVYIKPVFRGDRITCRGVVTGREEVDGRTRLKLEVWLENQDGVMTAAGWASAELP